MGQGPDEKQTTVRLHTGEQVALTLAQADRVYDELWLLAHRMKGAVAAAAKLKRIDTWTLLHGEDVLNEEETSALREALRRASRGGAAPRPRRTPV
jgi:hypothetical protein